MPARAEGAMKVIANIATMKYATHRTREQAFWLRRDSPKQALEGSDLAEFMVRYPLLVRARAIIYTDGFFV